MRRLDVSSTSVGADGEYWVNCGQYTCGMCEMLELSDAEVAGRCSLFGCSIMPKFQDVRSCVPYGVMPRCYACLKAEVEP